MVPANRDEHIPVRYREPDVPPGHFLCHDCFRRVIVRRHTVRDDGSGAVHRNPPCYFGSESDKLCKNCACIREAHWNTKLAEARKLKQQQQDKRRKKR